MWKVLFILVIFTYSQSILGQYIIGKSCNKLGDCSSGGSSDVICRDGICTCSDNTVPSFDSQQCISKVVHGGVCTQDNQCSYSRFAECAYGKCQCKAEYSYNGYTCGGQISLGSPCQIDEECSVEGDPLQGTVECDGSKQCSCKRGYKRQNERCVIGGSCNADSDCTGLENSWCDIRPRIANRGQSCNCNTGFVPAVNDTKCLPMVREVGHGCLDTPQCTAVLGEAYCSSSKQCVCVDGAHVNEDRTKCTSGAEISTVISISCLALVSLLKLL